MIIPEALAAARLRATNERPYLSAAIWSLVPVERPGLGTMAVDRYYRLYYDPAVLAQWSVLETAAALIHEITHLLREHGPRADELQVEPEPWGQATDCAINDDMVAEGLQLPGGIAKMGPDGKLTDGILVPSSFGLKDNQIEEAYYAEILQRQPPGGGGGQGRGQGQGQSQGQSGGGQSGGGQHPKPKPKPGQGEGQGQGQQPGGGGAQNPPGQQPGQPPPGGGGGGGHDYSDDEGEGDGGGQPPPPKPKLGSGDCGSCSGGGQREWEDEAPGKPNASDGLKPAEQKLVQNYVAKAVRDAAKERGTIPGSWQSWAEDVLTTYVPWTQHLQGALRGSTAYASGLIDYTYRKPSRRTGGFPGLVLPGMHAPKPDGCFVVDTSGSMSDEDVGAAIRQIDQCIRQVGFPQGVPVLAVDATLQKSKRVFNAIGLKDMVVGRGGTDMRVGIAEAMRRKPRPSFIVVLTDCATPWPEHPMAGVRLIIVGIGRYAKTAQSSVPKWARFILVDEIEPRRKRA